MTETLPKSKEQLKQDLLDIEEIIWDLRDELHMRILGKAAIMNQIKLMNGNEL